MDLQCMRWLVRKKLPWSESPSVSRPKRRTRLESDLCTCDSGGLHLIYMSALRIGSRLWARVVLTYCKRNLSPPHINRGSWNQW